MSSGPFFSLRRGGGWRRGTTAPGNKMSTRRTSRRLGARAPDTPMDDTDDGPATCAVCLEPMHEEGSTVALACSHTFHAACIVPWLQNGNRSCPTCRNKPPRQLLGHDNGSESDRSHYDSEGGYYDSEYDSEYDGYYDHAAMQRSEHQALHDEWNETWLNYLDDVHASEGARRNAISRAKRLANADHPRDKQRSREAKKLVVGLAAWREKAKERAEEKAAADKRLLDANMRLIRERGENHRWWAEKNRALITKREEKNNAAASRANLPGLGKEVNRLARAIEKAKKASRTAEEKLATLAGWSPPPVPQLPPGLRDCMTQPVGPERL